jgi:hypothetical protein
VKSIDDIPIGGSKPPVDVNMEEDVPPKGAYNLDNLSADAFGDGGPPPVAAAPKKGPPARLANAAKSKQDPPK